MLDVRWCCLLFQHARTRMSRGMGVRKQVGGHDNGWGKSGGSHGRNITTLVRSRLYSFSSYFTSLEAFDQRSWHSSSYSARYFQFQLTLDKLQDILR